jgi:radical SAM superfamily enzyme YgiQ (UPF0313 family)
LANFFPPPETVWAEMEAVIRAVGASVWFKDFGDCFSGDWNYAKSLLASRPETLVPGKDYFLEVYLKPGEVTQPWHAELLKNLGVERAFVGYESGSNRMLKSMRKGSTRSLHEKLSQLLIDQEIRILASYVIGVAGETEETLEETLDFGNWLHNAAGGLLQLSTANPVMALPGSPMWQELLQREPQYGTTDNPDIQQAQIDWFTHFCPNLGRSGNESLEILTRYATRIASLAPFASRFGWQKGQ